MDKEPGNKRVLSRSEKERKEEVGKADSNLVQQRGAASSLNSKTTQVSAASFQRGFQVATAHCPHRGKTTNRRGQSGAISTLQEIVHFRRAACWNSVEEMAMWS